MIDFYNRNKFPIIRNMKDKIEEFRDVPGYMGYYQVSDLGNVRSIDREVTYITGRICNYKGQRLKPGLSSNGYLCVNLSKNSKCKTFNIHVLVAMTYLGHIPDGLTTVVNHKDNNPSNNCLSNLNLKSQRENSSIDKWRYNCSSKATGVTWGKRVKKWKSYIWIVDKRIHLGLFIDEDEAKQTYKIALKFLDRYTGDAKDFRSFIKSKLNI